MPYWGALLKNRDFYVEAKIHGPEVTNSVPEELTEYINNLITPEYRDQRLAQYYAQHIAKAFQDFPNAAFVTVDVINTNGRLYGHTELIDKGVE